jgi:hypothetical protein
LEYFAVDVLWRILCTPQAIGRFTQIHASRLASTGLPTEQGIRRISAHKAANNVF